MNKNEQSAGTKTEQRTTAESGTSASLEQNGLLAAVLPCPFCGKEPFEGRTKDGRFIIKCYDCGVELMQDRKDKVRGHWNARHGS